MALNIPALTASAAATAFQIAGSITHSCTYVQKTATAYDTATGAVTESTSSTTVSDVIFKGISAKEVDGERVRTGDEVALIRVAAMPSVTPTLDDIITETGVADREVLSYQKDATGTMWRFHVRMKAR